MKYECKTTDFGGFSMHKYVMVEDREKNMIYYEQIGQVILH